MCKVLHDHQGGCDYYVAYIAAVRCLDWNARVSSAPSAWVYCSAFKGTDQLLRGRLTLLADFYSVPGPGSEWQVHKNGAWWGGCFCLTSRPWKEPRGFSGMSVSLESYFPGVSEMPHDTSCHLALKCLFAVTARAVEYGKNLNFTFQLGREFLVKVHKK